MAPKTLSFRDVIAALRRQRGKPPTPPTRDPFALVLWEQVAYLATDARRGEAFARLRNEVGLSPAAIAAAPIARLRAIARHGGAIAPADRAARMQKSAALVTAKWKGDLRRALALPLVQARRELARFPMIGEPGADKILALSGTARLVPLDSNALRVVQRVGLARSETGYAASYRAAREALVAQAPRTAAGCAAAGSLLRRHGQGVCKRSAPRCDACALNEVCPSRSKGTSVRPRAPFDSPRGK